MNFVIFPAFFISTAFFPLRRLRESGAAWLAEVARCNPFTWLVEMLRFALQGQFHGPALGVVMLVGLLAFLAAVRGYDPQAGVLGRRRGAEA